ncbi:MAG: metallophosphoesterase [Candidatus Pacearchaeota archaeon]|nr:MAG: metallophosphoesterase [Candidatus Pacearchaeota archaeon]
MKEIKILAIGDFHGKIPYFIKKVIKKEKPDLIISPGDFCPLYERKLIFKYSYGTDKPLWQVIGKKKQKEFTKKNLRDGKKVIVYIGNLNIPAISVTGNIDLTTYRDIGEISSPRRRRLHKKDLITPLLKKHKIKVADYKLVNFENLYFVGYPRSSYYGIKPRMKDKLRLRLKDYRNQKKRIEKEIKKIDRKNFIFISHNVPYKTKLDLIRAKGAHKLAKGKHYGSYLTRKIIEKHKPLLCVAGHMHENQGQDKIGKTLIINPGAAKYGKYAMITIRDSKIRVKFKK